MRKKDEEVEIIMIIDFLGTTTIVLRRTEYNWNTFFPIGGFLFEAHERRIEEEEEEEEDRKRDGKSWEEKF